jgi:hypothetical protein
MGVESYQRTIFETLPACYPCLHKRVPPKERKRFEQTLRSIRGTRGIATVEALCRFCQTTAPILRIHPLD